MKKVIFLIAVIGVFLTSVNLWGQDSGSRSGEILIVYFSRVGISESFDRVDAVSSASLPDGNTILAARMIHDRVGGTLHQILTEKVYPAGYGDTTNLARIEQNGNERPRLTNHVADMERYETIFIGYPNWWGTLPMAVFTFLEEYDFSGKIVVPFCTHEGSGLGRSVRDLRRLVPQATIAEGLAIRGGNVKNAEQDIVRWLKEIGYASW